MRRSRFAKAIESDGARREKASVREALWFDLSSPETPDHHSLSAWRVAPLDYSAVMLGVTHLIAAIALFVLHPEQSATLSFANPIMPMGLLLVLAPPPA